MKLQALKKKHLLIIPVLFIVEAILIIILNRILSLSIGQQISLMLIICTVISTLGLFLFQEYVHQNHRKFSKQAPVIIAPNEVRKQLQKMTRQMKQQKYTFHNLFDISVDLSSILDQERLIKTFLLALMGQLGSRNAVSILADYSEIEKFNRVFTKGLSGMKINDLGIEFSQFLGKYFKKNPRPLMVEDPKLTGFLFGKNLILKQLGFKWIAPLIHNGQLHGIVGIGSKWRQNKYSENEIEMFSMMSSFASVALSNALQYRTIEKISVTDGLTGLYNHRFFRTQLQRELERAQRFKHFVTLLILDVDYFKKFNDTHGHLAGDSALKKISTIIKNTARRTDLVSRYGGEEFCVILPKVQAEGAIIFGDRLRRKIESAKFHFPDMKHHQNVTVSLGCASFPSDAQVENELIKKADQALYHAKNNGRNRLCLFSEFSVHNKLALSN